MINLKLVFRSLKGNCRGKQIFMVLVHGCRWTQAASGTAGPANVGFCPADIWLCTGTELLVSSMSISKNSKWQTQMLKKENGKERKKTKNTNHTLKLTITKNETSSLSMTRRCLNHSAPSWVSSSIPGHHVQIDITYKPQVHDVLQCSQRITGPWPQVARTEDWTHSSGDTLTEKWIDGLAHRNTSLPYQGVTE